MLQMLLFNAVIFLAWLSLFRSLLDTIVGSELL